MDFDFEQESNNDENQFELDIKFNQKSPNLQKKRQLVNIQEPNEFVQKQQKDDVIDLEEMQNITSFKQNQEQNLENMLNNNIQNEDELQQSQQEQNLSNFYVNKLKYFDYDSPTQITFRQLMYEDPLYLQKKQQPKRSAISVLFTCKGFDEDIIVPLVKGGVRVTMLVDYVKTGLKQKQVQEEYKNFKDWTVIYLQGDYGCFHPKLWLIQFPGFLRVVVGSGNLQIPHWTHWNNCLWFKDFKKLPRQNPLYKNSENIEQILNKDKQNNQQKEGSYKSFNINEDFKIQLESFLKKIMPYQFSRYQDLLGFDINDYQFKNINIVLIPSMQGRFTGNDMNLYGLLRVKQVLLNFPPIQPYKNPIVTVQTSSVGNLNVSSIEEILSCLIPFNFYSFEDLKQRRANNKYKSIKELRNQFQVIFPSKKYIEEESIEGPQYSDCMFFPKKIYFQDNFAIQTFKAWQSSKDQEGTIPHLKTFIITSSDCEINDDTVIYFGSHNFTPSAFGKFENNFTNTYISNTELGGLYPPMKGSKEMKQQIIKSLPYQFPPLNYEQGDRPFVSDYDFPLEQ